MQIKLFKRDDSPFWFVDFWVDGYRFKKSTRFTHKGKAEKEALRIVQEEIAKIRDQASNTLSALVDEYISLIKTENTPKTMKDKVRRIKLFVDHIGGDRKLDSITFRECQNFILEMKKTSGLTPASVNRYIATYLHMFNVGIEYEMCEKNPFRRVKKTTETPRFRFFTDDEITRLTRAAKMMSEQNPKGSNRHLFYYIFLTGLFSGMRLGEILHLKWSDMGDYFVIQKSKSGLKRLVPIEPALRNELIKLMDVTGNDGTNSDYIFPLKRRASDVITKIFKKCAAMAGVENARFHDLRHYFGSKLIEAGADIITVSKLLGHSDTKTTEVYAHTTQKRKVEAVGKLSVNWNILREKIKDMQD